MKSKARKTGGAYRRKQRALSLHAKPGKDRSKSRGKQDGTQKRNKM